MCFFKWSNDSVPSDLGSASEVEAFGEVETVCRTRGIVGSSCVCYLLTYFTLPFFGWFFSALLCHPVKTFVSALLFTFFSLLRRKKKSYWR